MMLSEQYARACMPDRTRIYGVLLEPYAIGHHLVLARIASPYLTGGRADVQDLAMALYICSSRGSVIAARHDQPAPWAWRWRMYRILVVSMVWPGIYAERQALFRAYLTDAMRSPTVWKPQHNEGLRAITAPDVLSMRRSLMAEGYTARETLDMPFREAQFVLLARLEERSDGTVRFRTDQDAMLAGG